MSWRDRLGTGLKRFLYEGVGRDKWQRPDQVIDALGLKPGDHAADLGSGAGYFTFRLARAVSPGGDIFAVDTDLQLLRAISRRAHQDGLHNIETVASHDSLVLPHPVDLIFLSNVYHHLTDQHRYFADARAQLAPGGRVAIIESRPEGIFARFFGHSTEPGLIHDDMGRAGYALVSSHDFVDRHSFQIFRQVGEQGTSSPVA